ncbi:MAG: hypothetical protein V4736_11805 [Bdellovibrionota bacterium]
MTLLKTALVLSLALALNGCSNGSSSPAAAPANELPTALGEPAISQKPMLNVVEKDVLKAVFANSNEIPGVSLYLIKPNETESEKAERLKKTAALSNAAKATLVDIQSQCKLVMPTQIQDGQLKPEAGSSVVQTSNASASGAACPVNVVTGSKSTTTIIESTADFSAAKFSTAGTSSENQLVISDELQRRTRISATGNQMTFSALSVSANNTFGMHMNMSGRLTMSHLDYGQVTADIKADILSKGTPAGTPQSEANLSMNIRLANIDADVQMIQKNDHKRYYLNGQQLTEKEFKAIFGEGIDLN